MTPHTERAAAAAAELNRTYIIVFSNGDIEDGREVKNQELAAIIAKHFPDDAASISAAVFKANDGDYTGPTVSVAWAERFLAALGRSVAPDKQHDALRLAAGRALELLTIAPSYISAHAKERCLDQAITALSAALAGDKGKETK